MQTHELLHIFAKTWGALGMLVFFAGVVIYALRPGSKEVMDDNARIPLRNDKLGE